VKLHINFLTKIWHKCAIHLPIRPTV